MENLEWIITVYNQNQDDYYIISAPTQNQAIDKLCITYSIDDNNCNVTDLSTFIASRKTAFIQI